MKLHQGVVAGAIAFGFALSVGFAAAQESSNSTAQKANTEAMCPMHEAHMQASGQKERAAKETGQHAHELSKQLDERGEKGMGFSQSATTHHFILKPNGGAIQVEANDPAGTADRDAIRRHLTHIALAFSAGDFDIPMFVHDTLPPGVPEMKRLRSKIRYSYEETSRGGRVIIVTPDKESREAIHKFLRFQIAEHKTGDPIVLGDRTILR